MNIQLPGLQGGGGIAGTASDWQDTAFSKSFLSGYEEPCLYGSPLRSLLLNMPFENDAQWDVCTFVITKTSLVFPQSVPANFSAVRREIAKSPKYSLLSGFLDKHYEVLPIYKALLCLPKKKADTLIA